MTDTQYTKDDTIFVQIASYRDPELQHTLQDLFKKAKRPQNIFVGICHQYDMKGDEDRHLFEVEFPRPEQIRVDEVDYRETGGMCWARNRSQKLWQSEKWSLRIDSHCRFKESWDEELVNMIFQLRKNGEVIISQCLPSYDIKTQQKELCCSNRIACQNFISTFGIYKVFDYPPAPNLTLFTYGGFVFGLSKFVTESFVNPHLDNLDEVHFSITQWTKGVDIYSYHRPVIWHYWQSKEDVETEVGKQRKGFKVTKTKAISIQNDLLQIVKSNEEEILKLNQEYHIGNKRTLWDYQRFSGIDFRKKKLREHTKNGVFEEWREISKIQKIQIIFRG